MHQSAGRGFPKWKRPRCLPLLFAVERERLGAPETRPESLADAAGPKLADGGGGPKHGPQGQGQDLQMVYFGAFCQGMLGLFAFFAN